MKKKHLIALCCATCLIGPAVAGTVSYNTTGSQLLCDGVVGCIQNSTTSLSVGGLTLTYNIGSGAGVVTPSIINFGNLVSTGTGTNVNLTGIELAININSTPPGESGGLPFGLISGSMSTNNSGAIISFGAGNTTSIFGTLPGVVIGSGSQSFEYQVLNPTLGLQAPTVGNPLGQTSIQGAVTAIAPVPEPGSYALLLAGLGGMGVLVRRRRTAREGLGI